MITPSTASPRNSSRSFELKPMFSAHHERCTSAGASTSGSGSSTPRRAASSSRAGTGSGMTGPLEPREDVVDGVTHRLDVFQVLFLDAEADAPFADLLLQR